MAQGPYYGRQRAYGTLVADIEDFVRVSNARLEALMRASLNDVIDNSNIPVSRGGRMRVDTGFLRASGRAALGGWPSGPSIKPRSALPNSFAYEGDAAVAVLAEMKVGDTFFYGWTANYAAYRELYDGFMEGALMHWSRIVAFRTDEMRERIK